MQTRATIEVVTEGEEAPSPEAVARFLAAAMRCYIGPKYRIVEAHAVNNVTR